MTFCVLDADCVVYDTRQHLPGLSHHRQLCHGCNDKIRSELNLLRYDYVDLTQLLPPAEVRNELGKIARPKPESKPAMNMAAFHLRGHIAWLVAVVAAEVRKTVGGPRHHRLPVREGFALDADVKYLSERLDDVAALPVTRVWADPGKPARGELSGPQMLQALRSLHHRARKMCGTEAPMVTLPGWCPDCQTPSLRRQDELIWCVHCRRKFSAVEYGQAVRLQLPIDRNPH